MTENYLNLPYFQGPNSDTVIFDLDGTLADISKRREKATKKNGKINWGIFYDPENIKLDEPNYPVVNTFKALSAAGYNMVIFSGRSNQTQIETEKWLKDHGLFWDVFLMRDGYSKQLYKPDNQLKYDWLYNYFDDFNRIMCIFDDRDQVVEMWRSEGFSCFQVADGNF